MTTSYEADLKLALELADIADELLVSLPASRDDDIALLGLRRQ